MRINRQTVNKNNFVFCNNQNTLENQQKTRNTYKKTGIYTLTGFISGASLTGLHHVQQKNKTDAFINQYHKELEASFEQSDVYKSLRDSFIGCEQEIQKIKKDSGVIQKIFEEAKGRTRSESLQNKLKENDSKLKQYEVLLDELDLKLKQAYKKFVEVPYKDKFNELMTLARKNMKKTAIIITPLLTLTALLYGIYKDLNKGKN